jgi:ParB family chromosome partitioning protein
MKIRIDDIKSGARIRLENTDVSLLKKSIAEVGLLNPIIINEEKELLSGFRRLLACRELGWEDIEAIIFKTADDEIKKLDIEFHENLGRVELTDADRENYQQMRSDLLNRPKKRNWWYYLKRFFVFLFGLFASRKTDQQSSSN